MTAATTYITNDDLYNQFPAAHQWMLDNNQETITEDNYPQVEGFEVGMGEDGPVAFYSVRWSDGSETSLTEN